MKKVISGKLLIVLLFAIFAVEGMTWASGEQIKWQVISGGGTTGTSTNFKVSGTVGQTGTTVGTSTNFKVYGGFWQNFSCCVTRGDVRHNGGITISDLTYLVAYLFSGGGAPPCNIEADVRGNGGITVSDLTYLVAFLFTGGSAPPACT